MERAFAVIEAAALALWIGALAGFAFVFAPIANRTLSDVRQFGTLVDSVLATLNLTGYVCGALALLGVFVRNREDASLAPGSALRALFIVLMLLFVVIEARVIIPTMHAATQPAIGRLHALSTALYGLILLLGLAALALSVLARPESIRRRTLR